MKKIVLLLIFVMGAIFSQAQNAQIERAQAKEMDALTKIVTYNHKNLAFNKNQVAKLERLFFKKATETVILKNNEEIEKGDYIKEYTKIQDKYLPLVEAILTTPQRIEFRNNSKSQIRKMKD